MDVNKDMYLLNSNVFYPLLKSDEENIFCDDRYKRNFIKIGNEIYHVKNRRLSLLMYELIGEKISEYFNLNSVKSILVKGDDEFKKYFKETYSLLTKIFTNKNSVYRTISKTFPNVKIVDNIGLDNLDNLDYIYYNGTERKVKISEDNKNALIFNLKKKIVRDFISSQRDSHEDNMIFRIENDFVELMPVFDYEYSLDNSCGYSMFFNIFDFDLNLDKVINYVKNDNDFQLLLEKSLKLDIWNILKELENEYEVKFNKDYLGDIENIINYKKSLIMDYKLVKKLY